MSATLALATTLSKMQTFKDINIFATTAIENGVFIYNLFDYRGLKFVIPTTSTLMCGLVLFLLLISIQYTTFTLLQFKYILASHKHSGITSPNSILMKSFCSFFCTYLQQCFIRIISQNARSVYANGTTLYLY